MLTLFAIPKPFAGHIEVIQRNAIQSWLALHPDIEVILFGDEQGTAEVSRQYGATYVPGVMRNEYGTPLVSDLFAQAERMARYSLLCYVNADIILMSSFIRGLEVVAAEKRRFLMVSHRWDADITEPLRFEGEWEKDLEKRVRCNGTLHGPSGIDFFAFPRGLWGELPPFSVGRPAYDNWLLFRARQLGAALVDATPTVMIIHQNHHYGHNPRGKKGIWEGPEAQQNRQLAGGQGHLFLLLHASHYLTESGVKRALDFWHIYRQVEAAAVLHPRWAAPARMLLRIMDLLSAPLSRLKRLCRSISISAG